MDLTPDSSLPARYEPLGAARSGSEGLVLHAFDRERGLAVALKRARPDVERAEARLRLRRELAMLAELAHPGWPAGLDAGTLADGTPFYTMGWVPGVDVADLATPSTEAQVRGWLPTLAGALDRLHGLGLVHGDVSAANVRITPAGGAVLLDLGHGDRPGPLAALGGTLTTLAPEAIAHGQRDRRADWYGLGCVLYRALTGRDPFAGSPEDLLRAHLEDVPTAPRRLAADLSSALEAVLVRLLAKDPADRFADGASLLAALGLPALPATTGELLEPPLLGRDDALAGLDLALAEPGAERWLVGPHGAGRTRLLAAA
ncbi:MAG: serine/threonine protein kinase, partial [Cyanobacteria bacterium RYN_339]|nr:serine/threonine protein kinase [Cyanobacteria bacterium RYN_339]